jgi:hypothetical protein
MAQYVFNRPPFKRIGTHPRTLYRLSLYAACVGGLIVVAMIGETVLASLNGTLASGVVVEHKVLEPHEVAAGDRRRGRFCVLIEHPLQGTVTSRSPLCGRTPKFLRKHPVGTILQGSSEGERFALLGPDGKWQRAGAGALLFLIGVVMAVKSKRKLRRE